MERVHKAFGVDNGFSVSDEEDFHIIEQESYQGKTPLECVKIDLERMKTWGI